MRDKKFERVLGISSEKIDEFLEEKEVQGGEEAKRFSDMDIFKESFGKKYEKLCEIVKNPRNYEYDYQVAIFMLLGIDCVPIYSLMDNPKQWPFEVYKDKKNITTTRWCDALQSILNKTQGLLDFDVKENGRLGGFEYHTLIDIEQRLTEQIEEDRAREYKLAKNKNKLNGDEQDKLKEMCRIATKSRKENWFLVDIFLGRSLSFTLYNRIKTILKVAEVDYDIFINLIRMLSSLKCFGLRNIITDMIFERLLLEIMAIKRNNDLTDKDIKETVGNKVKEITDEVEPLIRTVELYYGETLTIGWAKVLLNKGAEGNKTMREKLNVKANSIGEYLGDSNLYPVESNKNTIETYGTWLKKDLKVLHNAKHDYLSDEDTLFILESPEENYIIRKKSEKWDEENERILQEEYRKIKEGEKRMKIVNGQKKIISNASVLFTYIHWEVMKMYGESIL